LLKGITKKKKSPIVKSLEENIGDFFSVVSGNIFYDILMRELKKNNMKFYERNEREMFWENCSFSNPREAFSLLYTMLVM
jgi:hypothetical protein